MPTITGIQAVEKLAAVKGATMATITARTEPSFARKGGNPFWDAENKRWLCVKVAIVNGVLNWIYSNSVNRQRQRENQPTDGDGNVQLFVPEKRSWGEHLLGTPFIYNKKKGRLHLEFLPMKTVEYQYQHPDTGEVIAKEAVNPLLREDKAKRQGVDKIVRCRDYALDNITAISFGGHDYQIVEG